MDLLLLAKVIWRKKWLWIIIPILSGIAGFLFTLKTVDQYVASAQLATGFTVNDQVQMQDERFNPRDADVKFSNLLTSLNSGAPVNFVSYCLLLHDLDGTQVPLHRPDPNKFQTTSDEIELVRSLVKIKLDSLSPLSTSDPDYNLIRKFINAYGYTFGEVKAGLNVKRIPNTDYIQVDFRSDHPELSALGANSFCEEFIRFHRSLKTERSGESIEFLTQLVREKKTELDAKLETQQIFKSSNSLLNVEREGESKLTQITELEKQKDEIISKMQRIELTKKNLNNELNAISGNQPNSSSNQNIIELRRNISQLNEKYITTGQTNKVLLDSINALRQRLRIQSDNLARGGQPTHSGLTASEISLKLNELDVEYQVSRSSLSLTEAKIRNLQYSFSGYASKEAKLEAIQREVDLASTEYLEVVTKLNDAKNRMASSNTLRQISVAFPPLYPVNSKRALIVGLAVFSSFVICLVLIVGFEFIDQSIKTPEKFSEMVGLPLAGALNTINTTGFNLQRIFSQTGDEHIEIFKSLMRKLRHEVVNLDAKVLLITSLTAKQGKTFSIISLAYVLSLVNKRVLIIDTNFKNNQLSQLLAKPQSKMKVIDGPSKVGLLVEHKSEQDRDFDENKDKENTYELINPTKLKNVFIVGNAGGGGASPAEILSGKNFNNLVEVLSESFDVILMEGPALNDYSDTKELVQYVDSVIPIFSAQSTISQQDKESIKYFRSLGQKLGGCILNRVDTKNLKL